MSKQDTPTSTGMADPQTGDGHYRPKHDLHEQSESSRQSCAEVLAGPGDALATRAQNPEELAGTFIGQAYQEAAGIPAILKAMEFSVGALGPAHALGSIFKINKPHGFDCQSCAWPSPDKPKLFEFCENGAKALADEGTKKRITREFFARHSVEQLAAQSDYWLNQQGRLTEPMVLRPGASHYEPISWEDTFALIGRELRQLGSPDEAAFYTSGKTTNEPAFLIQLFARQFGTNNLPDCSNMCHESSGVALVETIGVGKGTVQLDDFEKADLILSFGNNPGTNHPRMLTSLGAAKRAGAAIIAVNPLPETGLLRVINPNPQDYPNPLMLPFELIGRGENLADLHLPVRVNGDVAAIKGIIKWMLQEEDAGRGGGIDHDFIAAFTQGFDAFATDVRATPWEEIYAGSGLTTEQIRTAGILCARSERMICCWATGLTQQVNGVDNVAAVINLLLLGGHVGRSGAGACCVRGHSNVQGDRTMGVWERPPQAFLDALGREFNFTPPTKWGLDSVETLHAMHEGRLKVFLAISGNFVSNTPDTTYTAHAMRRVRLSAHVSTKLNRPHLITGETALILPCLGRNEKDVRGGQAQWTTVEDSMSIVSSSRGGLAPAAPGLLSEVEIIAGVAQATLGLDSPIDWRALGADNGLVRDHIARVIPGFHDFNARMEKEKTILLPNAARERIFKTASGKAGFTVCGIPEHNLAPGEYLLMTMRSHDQFNSTIYGLSDRYRGVFGGRRVIFLHPEDMTEDGWKAGQLVHIHSHFEGEVRQAHNFIVVPYTIPRRSAAAYYPETNVLVPVRSVALRSNQPAYKCIRITLEKSLMPMPKGVRLSAASIQENLQRRVG